MDISITGIVVSVLLSIIGLLFTVAVKLVLGRMDAQADAVKGFHADAMWRLDALNVAIIGVSAKIDEHVRNHATGEFKP